MDETKKGPDEPESEELETISDDELDDVAAGGPLDNAINPGGF